MGNSNEMTIIFDSRPENEGLARVAAAAFCTQLNPTLEEVADLKTAVSEAVTNCIIHGYQGEVQIVMHILQRAFFKYALEKEKKAKYFLIFSRALLGVRI